MLDEKTKEKKTNIIVDKILDKYSSKWCSPALTKEQIRSIVLAISDFKIEGQFDKGIETTNVSYLFKDENGKIATVERDISDDPDGTFCEDTITIDRAEKEDSDLIFKNPPLSVFGAFFYHCFE